MQRKQLITVTVSIAMLALTQFSMAQSTDPSVPTLRPGVSVQLPVTNHAATILDADKEDAVVVAVLRDGEVYLGTSPTQVSALTEKLKGTSGLYIKADANASYGNLQAALYAVHRAGITSLSLLTSQRSTHPGTIISPEGLDVMIGSSSSATSVVQLANSNQEFTVRINNRNVDRSALKTALAQLAQNQKVIVIEADGALPVSDVVSVIDECISVGAKVVLTTSAN